jgi:hypothetical protein
MTITPITSAETALRSYQELNSVDHALSAAFEVTFPKNEFCTQQARHSATQGWSFALTMNFRLSVSFAKSATRNSGAVQR